MLPFFQDKRHFLRNRASQKTPFSCWENILKNKCLENFRNAVRFKPYGPNQAEKQSFSRLVRAGRHPGARFFPFS